MPREILHCKRGAHSDAGGRERTVRVGNACFAEMEDARREHRAGMAVADPGDEIVEPPAPARGHDRHADLVGDRARKLEVISVARSVTVHAGAQQFAGTELREPKRVLDRVDPGRVASAMREHIPAVAASPGIARRASWDAEMSRKQSSSAPAAS